MKRSYLAPIILIIILSSVYTSAQTPEAVLIYDSCPTWSPDGTQIAFISTRAGEDDIWIMGADGSDLINLTSEHSASVSCPQWSPVANSIAFSSVDPEESDTDIFILSINNDHRIHNLTSNNRGSDAHPVWSPDGEHIAFVSSTLLETYPYEVWVMKSDGTERHRITPAEDTEFAGPWGGPVWSPDSDEIAFNSPDGIYLVTVETGEESIIPGIEGVLEAWAPGDEIIILGIDSDEKVLLLLDPQTSALKPLAYVGERILAPQPSWAPDKENVVYLTREFETFTMHIWNARTQETIVISPDNGDLVNFAPAWSPDSTQLVYESRPNRYHASKIWIINVDGSNAMQLTD